MGSTSDHPVAWLWEMSRVLAFMVCWSGFLQADPIRIKGSDLLGAKVVPLLCEEYRRQHPGAGFEIAAEGTFGPLPDFLAGRVDILMAHRELGPREISPFEKAGVALRKAYAMTDIFAIAVHPSNPVESLTLAQVEALFTGDHVNWKAVGGNDAPVSVYTRNTASSTYKQFQVAAMKGRPYSGKLVRLPGSDMPSMSVAKDPQGITYLGNVYARSKALKVVKIDGIDPLGKEVRRYPLLRPAFYYFRENARPEVKDFVAWMSTSPEAAELVRRTGFLKLE
jgi:phosphate transport system substrate-binding protein